MKNLKHTAALISWIDDWNSLAYFSTSRQWDWRTQSKEFAKVPFAINVRAEILSRKGGGLQILKKRPDINYYSKSTEKLQAGIFTDGVVVGGRETHAVTIIRTWGLEESFPSESSLWDVMKIIHNVP